MSSSATRFRTIWISDVHLGTKESRVDFLLDFLRHHESEYLYLVGDIFDGWALRKGWFWNQDHNDFVQKVLRKARKGTKVVYIPGNHDEFARQFIPLRLGRIDIVGRAIHTTAANERLLVLHGDEFDGVVMNARWLSLLGSWTYVRVLRLNRWFNRVRRWLGKPYWSLSAYLKHKAKRAVQYVADFETVLATEAKRSGVDGVVCGHIHHPEMQRFEGGIRYANCGDWVESCTALVERMDGTLEIVRWTSPASEKEPRKTRRPERAQTGRASRKMAPV